MKKAAEVKYPSSANLFQFCRRVLDHKFGGIRVIDQDVGQILGFDPADCSHWKKGKKNIRSIQAMKSIAEHLGIDERLVVDVASGEIDDAEAFFEYSGYGTHSVDNKLLETAKKEFYRRHATSWNRESENEFKELFAINESAIDSIVTEIHMTINFREAPLYLPEMMSAYPDLKLEAEKSEIGTSTPVLRVVRQDKTTTICYQAGQETRPFMRYQIAKAMAQHFLAGIMPTLNEQPEYMQHIHDIQSNIFAAKLLTPAALIRREMSQINVAKDIVSQLAETFWVSKIFMNRRLKDILTNPQA